MRFPSATIISLIFAACSEKLLLVSSMCNIRIFSKSSSFFRAGLTIYRRISMKALTTEMLIFSAIALFRTADNIITPCSVNTKGKYVRPPRPFFEDANCDLKDSNSSLVNWNINSGGKRRILRLTASLRRLVSTW